MSNGSGRSGKAGGTRRRVRARPTPVPSASRGRKRPPHPLPRSSSSTPPSMEQALPGRPARSRPCLGKCSRERHKPGVAESCLCRKPPRTGQESPEQEVTLLNEAASILFSVTHPRLYISCSRRKSQKIQHRNLSLFFFK